MNGIEKITGQIDADVQKEIDRLTADAKREAQEITERLHRQAETESKAILERGEKAAQQREERLASVAQLEARKLQLASKQEMVEKAFQTALKNLTSLPDKQYVSLLSSLAVQASRSGTEQVVFSPKDRSRFGKQVVIQANDQLKKAGKQGSLKLAGDTVPMEGGLILRDGPVETNCTFEMLIHLQRDSLAAEVAKVLFA